MGETIESSSVNGTVTEEQPSPQTLGNTCRPMLGRTKSSPSDETGDWPILLWDSLRSLHKWRGPGFEASPTREPRNPYLLIVRASCVVLRLLVASVIKLEMRAASDGFRAMRAAVISS